MSAIRRLQQNPTAAWCAPLFVFLGFLALSGAFKSDAADMPWWRAHPEHWVYPVQTIVCLGLVAFWWRHYKFRPITRGGIVLAVIAGVVGIVLWLLPAWLYHRLGVATWNASPVWEHLGLVERLKGFDPDIWKDNPAAWWSTVLMRFVRMAVCVPFVEELFWRGFLWRTLSDPYRDFADAKIGQWSAKALTVTCIAFAFAHTAPDRLAAVVWCLITSFVYVKTRSIGACVIVHAVSNLVLGLYVMATKQWGFW